MLGIRGWIAAKCGLEILVEPRNIGWLRTLDTDGETIPGVDIPLRDRPAGLAHGAPTGPTQTHTMGRGLQKPAAQDRREISAQAGWIKNLQ